MAKIKGKIRVDFNYYHQMKLRYRFSLLGIGIVLFLIITPLLVLYARGITYNFQTHQFIKTGAMVIQTQPTKALVFLNNKKIDDSTPMTIRFLLPDDYDVRVEKQGYQTWSKRLSVRSQYVTWINANRDFITLFLTNPKEEKSWPATGTLLSKNNDEIVFISANKTDYINIDTGSFSEMGPVPETKFILPPTTQTIWEHALAIYPFFQNQNNWQLSQAQIDKTSKIETTGTKTVLEINSDLYSFNPGAINSEQLALIDNNISAFTLDNNNIWFIQNGQLKLYSFDSNLTSVVQETLPTASSYQIVTGKDKIFGLFDNTLYVLNDQFDPLYSPVTFTSFNSASSRMFYGNNNEILSYSTIDQSTELILRSQTPISSVRPNFETGYVFFINEGKIKAVELDGRDHRNIYTILDRPGIKDFTLSLDGKKLYAIFANEIKEFTIR